MQHAAHKSEHSSYWPRSLVSVCLQRLSAARRRHTRQPSVVKCAARQGKEAHTRQQRPTTSLPTWSGSRAEGAHSAVYPTSKESKLRATAASHLSRLHVHENNSLWVYLPCPRECSTGAYTGAQPLSAARKYRISQPPKYCKSEGKCHTQPKCPCKLASQIKTTRNEREPSQRTLAWDLWTSKAGTEPNPL